MPRILPRLNAQVEKQAGHPKFFPFPKPKPKKSLYRPLPPTPSFRPADHPTSILLAPANPITNSWNYKRHKTLPPVTTPQPPRNSSQTDNPREMTSEELGWWSNPYRTCLSLFFEKFNKSIIFSSNAGFSIAPMYRNKPCPPFR